MDPATQDRVIQAVIVVAIMLLVALPVHEFSHALAAYRLGDSTAKMFGRLTLNPLAHFDPIGGTLLALTFIGSAATGQALATIRSCRGDPPSWPRIPRV